MLANWSFVLPLLVIWTAAGLLSLRYQPRAIDVIAMVGHDSPIRFWVYFVTAVVFWPTFGLVLIPIAHVDQWFLDNRHRWFRQPDPEVAIPAPYSSNYQFDTRAEFPLIGQFGFTYIDLELMEFYQWDGTRYVSLNYAPASDAVGLAATETPMGLECGYVMYRVNDLDIAALYPQTTHQIKPNTTPPQNAPVRKARRTYKDIDHDRPDH